MLQSGQKIAHFKILKKIGEGGMGEVYRAQDEKLGREVAIKILLSDFFEDRDRLDRFTREARTAASVSHANVMAIYDIDKAAPEGSEQEQNFIVMEHIRGESLTDCLKNKSLSTSKFLRIAERIASGLAAAHKLNIVHRDIKTDNIMIDEDGEPKILDFGLAKPVSTGFSGDKTDSTKTVSQELTQEGKIVGTVSYMSPEQARAATVDARSDVFSFGVLLYRMFAGKFPFEGDDQVSTIAKILEVKQIPLRNHNETVPMELQRIIDKCLQKNPDDRYQDTRDLVVDLRSLRRQFESNISDTSMSVTGVDAPAQSASFFGSAAFRWISVAAVLVASAVVLSQMMGWKDSGSSPVLQARENSLAILGFENKTGDEGLDWLEAGLAEILLTDLAQNGVLSIVSRNRVLDCLEDRVNIDDLPGHRECVEAARSLGATRVLSGSFFKLGEQIRIVASLEDVESGQILLGEKVVGEDPFVLVDSLTNKIAQALNIQEMLTESVQVADITSSSPEAYKEYILGLEKFWLGHHEDALVHLHAATNIDSTFALPYMRIGMVHVFMGRTQLGLPYFAAAKRFENRLPVKEKSLLDIYYNTWFERNFDDAFLKLEIYVKTYRDDKEGRTIYSLFMSNLLNNTEGALAQLDTVLMLDPRYQFALEQIGALYAKMEDYDKAIEYTNLTKKYYPESPDPYANLASYYMAIGRYDEALAECELLLDLVPGKPEAIRIITRIHILRRDFDAARQSAELYQEYHADDPYRMITYESGLQNIALWEGRFEDAIQHMKNQVNYALVTEDSNQIFVQYYSLAEFYQEVGPADSALAYANLGYGYAVRRNFQGLTYAMLIARIDTIHVPRAREIFDSDIMEARSSFPKEMWPILDNLALTFEGNCTADTSKIIEGKEGIFAVETQRNSGTRFELGRLLVLDGQYEKALGILRPLFSGDDVTNNAGIYLGALHFVGMAEEGLGNTQRAIEACEELLKYWGTADSPGRFVQDTRERLERLTS